MVSVGNASIHLVYKGREDWNTVAIKRTPQDTDSEPAYPSGVIRNAL